MLPARAAVATTLPLCCSHYGWVMDSELRVFDSYGAELASVAEGVVLFGAGNDLVRPHVLVEQDFSGPTQVSGVTLEVFQGTASVTLRCHQHKPGWC